MRYWLCTEDVNGICKGTVCESKNGSIKSDGFYICDIGSNDERKKFIEVTNKRYEVIRDIVVYNGDIFVRNYKPGCVVYAIKKMNNGTDEFVDSLLQFVTYCGGVKEQDSLRLIVDDKESLQVPVYDWMRKGWTNFGVELHILPVSGDEEIAVDNAGKFHCYMSSAVGKHLFYNVKSDRVKTVAKKMPVAEETAGKFEAAGREIGALVDSKQAQYGDAISAVDDIMSILYPNGVPKEKMRDMLLIVRMLDKICRLSLGNGEGGESPFKDLTGYSILGDCHKKNGGKENE